MDKSGAAFPHDHIDPGGAIGLICGLTKRELIAAMAMQGMCGNGDISKAMSENGLSPASVRKSIATSAVKMADELLLELEK